MTNSTRLNLYLALGKSDDSEITMIDSFFQYKDGLKGCTGSKFYFVSPEQIVDRNDIDQIKDDYSYMWKEQVQSGESEASLEEWLESFKRSYIANGGGLFIGHDTSYIHNLNRDPEFMSFASNFTNNKLTDLYDSDTGTFECVGGGRCIDLIDSDFESYISSERVLVHDLARMFEGGFIDLETLEDILTTSNIPFKKEMR